MITQLLYFYIILHVCFCTIILHNSAVLHSFICYYMYTVYSKLLVNKEFCCTLVHDKLPGSELSFVCWQGHISVIHSLKYNYFLRKEKYFNPYLASDFPSNWSFPASCSFSNLAYVVIFICGFPAANTLNLSHQVWVLVAFFFFNHWDECLHK